MFKVDVQEYYIAGNRHKEVCLMGTDIDYLDKMTMYGYFSCTKKDYDDDQWAIRFSENFVRVCHLRDYLVAFAQFVAEIEKVKNEFRNEDSVNYRQAFGSSCG